ncbi:hypothetical protein RCH23_003481 [Cryobacterium sp. CAN_C3]|nr:hypothetical protein [Cryobacterium sp. CAN_C3]
MEESYVARDLAAADDLRIRNVRRGTFFVIIGSVLLVGAWLTIPFSIYRSFNASLSGFSLGLMAGGVVLLGASIFFVVCGVRVRRRALREHAVASVMGKANPAFDGDRKTLPTGGVPLSWIGHVPGS